VPADTPVTTPVVAFTVATAVLLLLQMPPATVELKVLVPATQIDWVPLNTPAFAGVVHPPATNIGFTSHVPAVLWLKITTPCCVPEATTPMPT
jgi:hypothetical protein